MLDQMPMPGAAPSAEEMPMDDMEMMEEEEEMPTESPLAQFSDEEIMDEVKARGLV